MTTVVGMLFGSQTLTTAAAIVQLEHCASASSGSGTEAMPVTRMMPVHDFRDLPGYAALQAEEVRMHAGMYWVDYAI